MSQVCRQILSKGEIYLVAFHLPPLESSWKFLRGLHILGEATLALKSSRCRLVQPNSICWALDHDAGMKAARVERFCCPGQMAMKDVDPTCNFQHEDAGFSSDFLYFTKKWLTKVCAQPPR